MKRLFNEDQACEERCQRSILLQFLPQSAEGRDRPEIFIPIQREGAAHRGTLDDLRNASQPISVGSHIPREFDLEMREPLRADKFLERVGQSIVDDIRRSDIARRERISHPDRMPRDHRARWLCGQKLRRFSVSQFRMNPPKMNAQGIFANSGSEGAPRRATERVNYRAFDERYPEPGEQGREPSLFTPGRLLFRDLFPPGKNGFLRWERARDFTGGFGHLQHVRDLLAEICLGIFGEPLRGKIVRGETEMRRTIDLHAYPDDQVRHTRHGGDPIAERHPQRQVADEKLRVANSDAHAGEI